MLEINTDWLCMKRGDKEAFLRMYELHYNALFSYGFSLSRDREITKDCIQEMFLELWDTKESITQEVQNIRSYLFTWLRRKISRMQARIIKERSSEEYPGCFEYYEPSYEELLISFQDNKEKKEELARALNNLTKKQIELLRLRYFENLSYTEISVKTNLKTRTVYNTIYLAIRQLREKIMLPQHV